MRHNSACVEPNSGRPGELAARSETRRASAGMQKALIRAPFPLDRRLKVAPRNSKT